MTVQSDVVEHSDTVLRALSVAAQRPGLTPQQALNDLLRNAGVEQLHLEEFSGIWTGNVPHDVGELFNWSKDHPSTLGDVLVAALPFLESPQRREVFVVLETCNLCSQSRLQEVQTQYTQYATSPLPVNGQVAEPGLQLRPSPGFTSEDPEVHCGEILHWDRDQYTTLFLQMIRGKSNLLVLAIPGLKVAGIGSLLDRFELMCDHTPDLIRVRYHCTSEDSLHILAANIIERLIGQATGDIAQTCPGLSHMLEESQDALSTLVERRAGQREPDQNRVARLLMGCLKNASRLTMVVLILEDLHLLHEDARTSVIDKCLVPHLVRSGEPDIKLRVVVTGGEPGLDRLRGPRARCMPPVQTLDFEHLVTWADALFGPGKLSREEIQTFYDEMKGDVEEFRNFAFYTMMRDKELRKSDQYLQLHKYMVGESTA